MTVFIITYEDPARYGSDNPVAVTSTRPLAETWISEHPDTDGGTYNIHEFVVDGEEVIPERAKPQDLWEEAARLSRQHLYATRVAGKTLTMDEARDVCEQADHFGKGKE